MTSNSYRVRLGEEEGRREAERGPRRGSRAGHLCLMGPCMDQPLPKSWETPGMAPRAPHKTCLQAHTRFSVSNHPGWTPFQYKLVMYRCESSIESVIPSNHLILCHPLLLWPSIFPRVKVFSRVSSLYQVAKVLELQHQCFQ